YKDWVDLAFLQNVHVVAACNNINFTRPEWPGHFSTVITTNMANSQGNAFFYRPGNLVSFAARGVDVQVPWMNGGYKTVSGSSYATPRVAGILARLLSSCGPLSAIQAQTILTNLAEPWREGVAASNEAPV
ncbi:MAG: S8 family serine peptidase, partial [Verrucomicrobiota bacterium]